MQSLLAPWATQVQVPEPGRLDLWLDAQKLVAAVQAIHQKQWGYLSAITGLDHGSGNMEVLYHFCEGPAVVTLRVPLRREAATVPSLCGIIPSASVHERELMEFFGIVAEGSPDPSHLYLPDGWPDGVYPLRKDFDSAGGVTLVQPSPPTQTESKDQFIIPMGPQHPALKEPAHFAFTVEGETVTAASVHLGYVHRGIEKATESRTWTQNLYLLERICGICSHIHALAYCLGVERLAGVNVPPRAQAIRELVAGLERFHSHMLWFGVAAHEAGYETLFMYSWRDRETVMDLLEELTGQRVNYSVGVLGGVKYDVTPAQADKVRRGLDYLDERLRHYLDVVTTDATFVQRTRGIGVIAKEQALVLGTLGPTARASGVARDVRVEAPYSAYVDFPVRLVTESAGDLEARFVVRIKELLASSESMRDLLDRLPGGELTTRLPRRIPAGETISRVEAPRGELFYFIKSNGSDIPERIKIRTPTLCNMASVMTIAIGHQLADMPMLLVGVDPCFSCNDRVTLLKSQSGGIKVCTWEELQQYGHKERT